MRFVEGVWTKLEGSTVHSAQQAARVEVIPDDTERGKGGDALRILCSVREIKHRGDILNKPTITVWIRSPAPGIFEVEAKHFVGKQAFKEPRIDLFPAGKEVVSSKSAAAHKGTNGFTHTARGVKLEDHAVLISAGGLGRARVDTRPGYFAIDILDANEKLLSSIGPDSLSWALKTNVDGSHASREYATTTTLDHYHRPEPRRQGYMIMSPSLAHGEKVYGLGEQFGPFVKNGQTVEISNEDGGTSSAMAYKNIPFYLTSKGVGIYVDQTQHVSMEIQTEHRSKVQISVPGEVLRTYFIVGPTPKDIITRYTTITGRPTLPPAWTWGLWLSTSFLTDYDEKTSFHFLDGMQKHDIQVSVFHFDCYWMRPFEWCSFRFNPEFFPDPKAFLKRINDRGIKVSVWINPYVAQEAEIFAEGDEKGYFLHRRDGSTYQSDDWQGGLGFVDFTNPDARKWYQSQIEYLIDMGVTAFKTDFGERVPCEDIVYFSGVDSRAMHNHYSFMYNRTVYEVLQRRLGEDQACLFARSAAAGGQRFPVHWAGDSDATWTGMSEALRGGLSLTLSGFAYHAQDIGGFKAPGKGGQDETSASPPLLYKRWMQYGLLSSHSRLHGSGTARVPWLVDEESITVCRKFVQLKARLLPYLLNTAIEQTVAVGHPIMRAMLLEFPEDPIVWHLDSQYMFGEALLVAPIFGETEVEYYLPPGKWTHLLDGRVREGGRYIKEEYSVMSLPLFLREGYTIVVAAEGARFEDDVRQKGLTVVLAQATLDQAPNGKVTTSISLPDGDKITLEVSKGGNAGEAEVKVVAGSIEAGAPVKVNILDAHNGLDGHGDVL